MLRIMSSVAANGNYIITALFIALCCSTTSLAMVNPSPPPGEISRRSLLTRVPFAVMGATASLSIGTAPPKDDILYPNHCDDTNCQCSKCQHKDQNNKYQSIFRNNNNNNLVVNAYERRDVGDETSSGETKAMNDQAYETNNRLERDGLVLEVRENNTLFNVVAVVPSIHVHSSFFFPCCVITHKRSLQLDGSRAICKVDGRII